MTILVIGASGNVGRAVLAQLLATGERVRAASRDPGAHHFPDGVEAVTADLERPDTLPAALAGVDKLFLYARPHGTAALLTAAKAAGVAKVVLLSSAAVAAADAAASDPIAAMHIGVERAIADSGLAWTFVRPTAFATNAATWWARSIRTEGVVRLAYPEAQAAPIHEADIAAVAVAALVRPDLDGATPNLTGPQSLTQRAQVDAIAEAIGRPLRIQALEPDEARAHFGRFMPAPFVEIMLHYWAGAVDHPTTVTPDVEQVLGRPALTFAQWARDHAADFAPTAA
jgi:uncharacterized protein YbjT (DUF2867 family)